jgi:hypothetical protein
VPDAGKFVDELADFIHIQAKLPGPEKNFLHTEPIEISVEQSREQIIDHLRTIRRTNTTADLAFYAYRDMESCDWAPFIKAAVERNPVSIEMTRSMSIDDVYNWLEHMKNDSIYEGNRLAQPDEVANYNRGDGLEKAFLLANIIRERNAEQDINIDVNNKDVILEASSRYQFTSDKGFKKLIGVPGTN